MPLIHTRTFRVHQYECDAYGHVNNANYLRYMQEAAFDASAAAGYDPDRYAAMGRGWLIRETDIEYLRPLRYGDSVTVNTWVADFRRVRSRRAYELISAGSGKRAARAHTDWVFVESVTGKPTRIPPELMATFFPEGVPTEAPPRERFPAPDPPPGAFIIPRPVAWQDVGPEGHVNNAVFLSYIEDGGIKVAAAHGWPMARCAAEGFAIVARRHRIEYREPALMDDELALATWISEVRRSCAVRQYCLTRPRDGAVIARAHTQWVWVDISSGRPMRVPDAIWREFADNIFPTA